TRDTSALETPTFLAISCMVAMRIPRLSVVVYSASAYHIATGKSNDLHFITPENFCRYGLDKPKTLRYDTLKM
ncbi:MAG: hypothetical protein VB067_02645, partial [Christensenellaceae bacterium]|nr:hypothetical protein [Christensenellaceae bacterium]